MANQYNEEQKALSTASILTSLLTFMDEKTFKTITISEVCKKAGVSRMAFYRHFTDLEEVLSIHLEERFEAYVADAEHVDLSSSYQTSILLFNYIKKEQHFFRQLTHSNHLETLHAYFENFMIYFLRTLPLGYDLAGDDLPYYAAYRAGGLVRLVISWLNNDMEESIEHMADLATVFDL